VNGGSSVIENRESAIEGPSMIDHRHRRSIIDIEASGIDIEHRASTSTIGRRRQPSGIE